MNDILKSNIKIQLEISNRILLESSNKIWDKQVESLLVFTLLFCLLSFNVTV